MVNQLIRSQAHVTIEPAIRHGRPKVSCLDYNIRPSYDWEEEEQIYCPPKDECIESSNKCSFILSQLFRVEIPIEMDVDVNVDKGIIRCGNPSIGPWDHKHKEINCDDFYENLNIYNDESEL